LSLLDSRWFKIYLLAVAGLALIAVAITVIVNVSRRPQVEISVYEPEYNGTSDLKLSDFMIEDPLPMDDPDWTYARQSKDRWSQQEVDYFWVDPVEIGIEELEKENDKMVEDFFEAVP